jgi:hypothetical protein
MDHKYINEFDLVERYLTGRLAAEETAQFEEHFVDCLQCVDRLKTTKAFMEGLRLVASDRTPEASRYTPRGFWYFSGKSLAVAAGVLLLVALASAVVVFNQILRARVEADQAKAASTQWERRYEEERQSSANAEAEHRESERELTEQVAKLRTELENEGKQEADTRAQVNLPILVLSSTRGSEPSSGSSNEVTLARSSGSFVISLTLEGERADRDYLMTILGSRNQVIWKGRGIRPNRHNSVSVGFNSTLFRSGDYLLTVEGVAGDGSTSVVGKYSFRVRKTP